MFSIKLILEYLRYLNILVSSLFDFFKIFIKNSHYPYLKGLRRRFNISFIFTTYFLTPLFVIIFILYNYFRILLLIFTTHYHTLYNIVLHNRILSIVYFCKVFPRRCFRIKAAALMHWY